MCIPRSICVRKKLHNTKENIYRYSSRKVLWGFELGKLMWKVARNRGKLHQHRFFSAFSSMFYNTDTNTHTGYFKTQRTANTNSEVERLNQFFSVIKPLAFINHQEG